MVRTAVAFLVLLLVAEPVIPATCAYRTIAGPAVTFRGNGTPVSQSVFNGPQAIIAASDGSIYIADTENNRIRRISPDGIISTVAGTGQPAFLGDGGAALQAALNQPAGLALAPKGGLYISDTGNNRVRIVLNDGTIQTVAGEGHARFAGDEGRATSASLNRPTELTVDTEGNLFILDSGNNRVRRVGTNGIMTTAAGSAGRDDYNANTPCCEPAPPTAPGVSVPLFNPHWVRAAADGAIYISDDLALRRLDNGGALSTTIFYARLSVEQALSGAVPVADLQIASSLPLPQPDGTLILVTTLQQIRIEGGTASPFHLPNEGFSQQVISPDPSTGGFVVLNPLDGS